MEVPGHIGIILDGNRRWAHEQNLPTLEGHRRGYLNLKEVIPMFFERGVKFVSTYVFSTENWKRSQEEVGYLMDLLYEVATVEVDFMNEKNVKVKFLGSQERLSPRILKAIRSAEELTAANNGGTVAFCLNYGGQMELVEAFQKMLAAELKPKDITPELVAQYLYAPEIPPVDLVIRTSGEQRTSNFMTWRAAYAEIMFIDKHWPDFDKSDVDRALRFFATRQRRFGK